MAKTEQGVNAEWGEASTSVVHPIFDYSLAAAIQP